jgi:hypothetical protein
MSDLLSSDSLKYEIFRVLHGANGPLSSEEIAAKIGVAASAVTSCLHGDMLPKGDVSQDNLLRWNLRTDNGPSQPHSVDLEAQLNQAREQVESLQEQLAKAQWKLEQAGQKLKERKVSDKVEALYLKVGLAPGCDDHVFRAVRKAHRREFHPDRKPEEEKEAAHKRFVELERIFDKLVKQRK